MATLAPGVVPASVVGLVDLSQDWRSRLRPGAYTSPSDTRLEYLYEDVRREGTKRGSVFQFPGVNGAYVQQKGFGPRQYPLRCFFSGPQHDLIADQFEAGLYEDGHGKLEHPLYGTFEVVPLGVIARRDDLARAANQSVVEVTFLAGLLDVYPAETVGAEDEILKNLGDFDAVAAQEFANRIEAQSSVARATMKGTVRGFLRDVSAALQTVSQHTSDVRAEFDSFFRLVNEGIDVLVGQPVLLAQQLSNLVQAPARALSGIQSRLEGYANLLDSIFTSPAGRLSTSVSPLSRSVRRGNDFQIAQLLSMQAVAGTVRSAAVHEFATKPEALAAAVDALDRFDEMVAWRESGLAELGAIDEGGAYQTLHEAVARTAGSLVEASFSLVPERRIVLDRPRTIVDLAAELYGSVDDRLDLLITSNNLTGSEILELPRGRTIAYYPEPG